MHVRFVWVATFFAVFFWAVTASWVFLPSELMAFSGLPADDGAGLANGLRIGGMLLGWGVMLFLARREPPSRARNAIAIGSAVGLYGFLLVGLYLLIAGIVGPGMLTSMAVELLGGTAFLLTLREPVARRTAGRAAEHTRQAN